MPASCRAPVALHPQTSFSITGLVDRKMLAVAPGSPSIAWGSPLSENPQMRQGKRSYFHMVLPSIHPTDFSLLWAALGVDAPWISPVSLPAFQPVLHFVTRAPARHLSRSLCMPVWWWRDLPDNRTGTWDSIFSAQPNQLPLTHLLPMSKIMLLFPLLLVFVLVDFCREKPLYCCNGVWEGSAGKCRHSICLPTPRLP